MFDWNIFWLVVAGVILFLFSLEKFTNDVQRAGGEKFKIWIKKLTSNRWKGTLVGALVTGIIQSSAATVIIVAGLTSAGVISFFSALGVIIGANIGTTITAQLVAFKLTVFAPFFIIFGFLIRFFGEKYRLIGKAVFYFGLILFSLNLVSIYADQIANSEAAINFFMLSDNLFFAILIGFLATVFFQSSSITTGLVVVLVGTSLLNISQGLGIILGANIGSTSTSLFFSIKKDLSVKRSALAHFLFNLIGVILIFPFFDVYLSFVESFGGSSQIIVANAHLIFNVFMAVIFLIFMKYYYLLIIKILPDKKVVKKK